MSPPKPSLHLTACCLIATMPIIHAQALATEDGGNPAAARSSETNAGAPNASYPTAADRSPVRLPTVPVEGQEAAESLAPFASSSVTGAELQRTPETRTSDILLDMPGVFFQNAGAPGLSLSVRGLQDFGRVNVMVDGARQDFMVNGHGANSSVYVDPALLSGVDVTRGTVSTANGAGAIGGVVNLRTLGIDDVLQAGQRYGAITTDLYGDNAYHGSGMIAAGARLTPAFDLVGAFSVRSSGDYADGEGNTVANTGQRLQSGLIKADIVPGADQTLQLGGIFYHNTFGAGSEGLTLDNTVQSTTATAQYHWVPAGNPWADLHAQGSYTGTRLAEFTPGFVGVTEAPADLTHYELNTYGVEADNTTRIPVANASLSLNYGIEYYRDEETTTDQTGNAGTTPSGHRSVASGFAQATLDWSLFQVIGAMRYDSYSLNGSGINQTGGITSLAAGPYTIDKSTGAASPKITFAVNPFTPWMLYASYGLGFRPPALTETLMEGAHPGLGFLRFVPNPDLDPERTHGWEVGSKLAYTNLFTAADTLTFKADYFRTHISHYIDQTLVPSNQVDTSGGFPIPIDGYYFVNLGGATVTKGFELQGGYDARRLFLRLAYSNILTDLGTADYTGFGQIVTAPPRSVFSGTAGVRLLGDRLVLGERTRAVSRTTGAVSSETALATSAAGYVIEDLFGSYQLIPNLKLFASVENVGAREYLDDALATNASPGRTFKVGFTAALGR